MYLNCHSCFSFRYGVMTIEELLTAAQAAGAETLALTDINNTSGCLDFLRLAPKFNIRPLIGVDFRRGSQQQYVAIARNKAGFAEINRFLSGHLHHHAEIPPRAPAFQNALVIYPFTYQGPLRENEFIGVATADLNRLPFSKQKDLKHKLVALQPATFRNKKDHNVHRLLRAVDLNTLLTKVPANDQATLNDLLSDRKLLEQRYSEYPWILDNTRRILSEEPVDMQFGKPKNKQLFTGDRNVDHQLLRKISYEGLSYRYGTIDATLEARMEKELELIITQGFCSYFLINWDIVQYAKSRGYYHVGRGSGANSLAAYSLGITNVDPIDLDLYFERFMNEYRKNPPDFDIDFSWKDRDDITHYIFNKYGNEHVALLGSYNTFQSNAMIRELGKVFGLPKSEIDKLVSMKRKPEDLDRISSLIFLYSRHLHDLPNHLSIHASGIIISEEPMFTYTATIMPPKGFPTTQFSMLEAEDVGFYKLDILSQRGLGHIRDTLEIVKENTGNEIDIHDIRRFKDDEKIKEHLREARTMGCFYVESPAMRMLLKKLGAEDYKALVAASSIIRPGVAQSGMMKAYIQRFKDPSARKYIHPLMKELMEETYGIMVYQEDVIKVAHHFAGLTLAEADVLRRGMSGKFKAREEFQKAQDKFIEGCRKKGYPEHITHEVWRQVASFAGYSFSKGHSASFAVESYQSMYLKAYYPLEFMVGVINNFGGFYRTEMYVHEARMNGANIHAPCINNSRHLTSIKEKDIYLGFIHLSELEQKTSEAIIEEREQNGLFISLEDFMQRVPVSREQLRILIRINAFRFTGISKKELQWKMYGVLGQARSTKVGNELFQKEDQSWTLPVLEHNPLDDAIDEVEILGFPLCSPFDLLEKPADSTIKAADLKSLIGKTICMTGYLVTIKYTRTIKNEDMAFGSFLDMEGRFFDTTHFPKILAASPFRGSGCYLIKGRVVEEFDYPSLDVESMEKLPMKAMD